MKFYNFEVSKVITILPSGKCRLEETMKSIGMCTVHRMQQITNFNEFYTVCTVHRNQFYKQTNKMHTLYVFILQFLYNSTCFERPIRSSPGVHDLTF